mmetsp:Transcript_15113/g.32776  ORF Transcript_15113/g.32776 Transcript_15113/m.32776 type:complete len:296 (-) Transcript_15113:1026-1913(-)
MRMPLFIRAWRCLNTTHCCGITVLSVLNTHVARSPQHGGACTPALVVAILLPLLIAHCERHVRHQVRGRSPAVTGRPGVRRPVHAANHLADGDVRPRQRPLALCFQPLIPQAPPVLVRIRRLLDNFLQVLAPSPRLGPGGMPLALCLQPLIPEAAPVLVWVGGLLDDFLQVLAPAPLLGAGGVGLPLGLQPAVSPGDAGVLLASLLHDVKQVLAPALHAGCGHGALAHPAHLLLSRGVVPRVVVVVHGDATAAAVEHTAGQRAHNIVPCPVHAMSIGGGVYNEVGPGLGVKRGLA